MNHIEDITKIAENRLPQRAYYIPQNQGAYTLLNGKWDFSYYADGKNFTKTHKGKFKFEIDDNAEFVYIVTPSGYVADWTTGVPAFYQSAEGVSKFNFELSETKTGDSYSIVAIADPQTKNMKQFKKFAGKPMADLCETVKTLDGVAVGLALGDICWDKKDIIKNAG